MYIGVCTWSSKHVGMFPSRSETDDWCHSYTLLVYLRQGLSLAFSLLFKYIELVGQKSLRIYPLSLPFTVLGFQGVSPCWVLTM